MTRVLQRLYESEINFLVRAFWDAGFDWGLGDEVNGIIEAGHAGSFDEAVADLAKAAIEHFPNSDFARRAEGRA
jgi:hypothetical protein